MHAHPQSEAGASPVVIAATVAVLALVFMIFKGLAGSSTTQPEAASASVEIPDPLTAVADARAAARRSDSVLRETTRLAREDEMRQFGHPAPERPKATPNQLNRLNSVISQAQSLWSSGRAAAMRIPEASVDAGLNTAAARTATQQWNSWSRSWSNRLQQFGRRLSQAGDGIGFDSPAYLVYQDLSWFISDLSAVTVNPASTTNIPMMYWRESQFDVAKQRLDDARNRIRELMQQG